MTDKLELIDVSAGYGRTRILNDVHLAVARGETLAVLGPNGAGKSTLAKSVMSLVRHFGGVITWAGKEIHGTRTSHRIRAGIGYVPQVENVFRPLTVGDNMDLAATGMPKAVRAEQFEWAIDKFPIIKQRWNVVAGSLSGGERRSLALASALIREPGVLILDEPTSDLSSAAIEELFITLDVIRAERNLSILLVEQNVGRALDFATSICVLMRGRVVVERPSTSITEREIGDIFLGHAAPKLERTEQDDHAN
jgi:ABC-type branched-subunit amino acid transport system ATPase component